MADYSKWIGGAIGWAVFGPIGALLGFTIGSVVDSLMPETKIEKESRKKYRHHTTEGDFTSSLLVLSAAVMKADHKLLKSELNYIKNYFKDLYGAEATAQHMKTLQGLLKKDIPIRDVCIQIRFYMEHSNRLQLMYYLFGIALSDGEIHQSEKRLLYEIAKNLGISYRDYESIRAMFEPEKRRRSSARSSYGHDPYKVLEITKDATDAEVKKAYRLMARKYHPDRLQNLGPDHTKKAQEKFVQVDEAYNEIKERRGMK